MTQRMTQKTNFGNIRKTSCIGEPKTQDPNNPRMTTDRTPPNFDVQTTHIRKIPLAKRPPPPMTLRWPLALLLWDYYPYYAQQYSLTSIQPDLQVFVDVVWRKPNWNLAYIWRMSRRSIILLVWRRGSLGYDYEGVNPKRRPNVAAAYSDKDTCSFLFPNGNDWCIQKCGGGRKSHWEIQDLVVRASKTLALREASGNLTLAAKIVFDGASKAPRATAKS
jgi:hypothetical protein